MNLPERKMFNNVQAIVAWSSFGLGILIAILGFVFPLSSLQKITLYLASSLLCMFTLGMSICKLLN